MPIYGVDLFLPMGVVVLEIFVGSEKSKFLIKVGSLPLYKFFDFALNFVLFKEMNCYFPISSPFFYSSYQE